MAPLVFYWMATSFCKRYIIRFTKSHGESAEADDEENLKAMPNLLVKIGEYLLMKKIIMPKTYHHEKNITQTSPYVRLKKYLEPGTVDVEYDRGTGGKT